MTTGSHSLCDKRERGPVRPFKLRHSRECPVQARLVGGNCFAVRSGSRFPILSIVSDERSQSLAPKR